MERLASNGLCAKEFSGKKCVFATKRLASLVLAWYAVWEEHIFFDIRDRLYTVPENEWCKAIFDKVLETGMYDEAGNNVYIEATDMESGSTPVRSQNIRLPRSFSEGIYSIRHSHE